MDLFVKYKYWRKTVFVLIMSILIISGGLLEVYAITYSGSLPIGSYVQLGMYKDKPIVWMVVHNDDNGSILLSKDIITVKAFDANGDKAESRDSKYNTRVIEGSNYWTKANLCEWLNSEEQIVNYSHQEPDAAHTMGVSYSTFVTGKSRTLAENVSYAEEPGFLTNFNDMERAAIQAITLRTYLSKLSSTRLF